MEWSTIGSFFCCLFTFLWTCTGLRLLMLDVPTPTILGDAAELTCSFQLQGDSLYSVRWYKDEVEFYRYLPREWPPGQFLPLPGVELDLSRATPQSVYLRKVNLDSSGIYRCEVSADAPFFQTEVVEKEMVVMVLPSEGPKILGAKSQYQPGDPLLVNCTSSKSKPAATIKWFINDILVGSEYLTEYSTQPTSDGLETASMSLKFVISEKHFKNSNTLRLKCSASVSTFYTMSHEERLVRAQQTWRTQQVKEAMISNTACLRPVTGVLWFIVCLACFYK